MCVCVYNKKVGTKIIELGLGLVYFFLYFKKFLIPFSFFPSRKPILDRFIPFCIDPLKRERSSDHCRAEEREVFEEYNMR